jgi:hypothetical protein
MSSDMALCSNPNTCEQDYATLCPTGWALCTPKQFNNRNGGWNFALNGKTALGEIRCRQNSGAGHFTVSNANVNQDQADNCWYGSSRTQCAASYGCNEKGNFALCCRPTSTCGDNDVDQPEEECDDGNMSNDDQCFNNCMTKTVNGC